mmetsp:Transcript_6663/g.19224  ORF Transcript_6663/g.19224 Transcript_6663/m.19224 type:complete len:127 (+) Transcript_6663:1809-2189(+)
MVFGSHEEPAVFFASLLVNRFELCVTKISFHVVDQKQALCWGIPCHHHNSFKFSEKLFEGFVSSEISSASFWRKKWSLKSNCRRSIFLSDENWNAYDTCADNEVYGCGNSEICILLIQLIVPFVFN